MNLIDTRYLLKYLSDWFDIDGRRLSSTTKHPTIDRFDNPPLPCDLATLRPCDLATFQWHIIPQPFDSGILT